jgi:hypothetical protein
MERSNGQLEHHFRGGAYRYILASKGCSGLASPRTPVVYINMYKTTAKHCLAVVLFLEKIDVRPIWGND